MKNYLLRIETYGIKNIKDKVSINFNNETIKLVKEKNKSVKAIFGLNGSGKSALINSIKFYKKIVYKNNILINDNDVNLFKKVINNEIKEYYFKIYFLNCYKNKKTVYSHEVLIKMQYDIFYIASEKLEIIKGQTVNSDERKTIYSVENGKLHFDYKDELNDIIKEKTQNLLDKSSLISLVCFTQLFDTLVNVIENDEKYTKDDDADGILNHIAPLVELISEVNVYLEGDDDFENSINFKLQSKDGSGNDIIHINISSYEDKILKTQLSYYIKQLDKQTEFIKIFKPKLIKIDPDIKEDGEYLRIKKIFNYGNYTVDSEFESTGIKKLMSLFNFIEDAFKGKIVFIDEMDANINGVFLDKLLEYFIESGTGILCFTSHNYEPMSVLRKEKGALLFLGETGKLVSLPKNGNSNPVNYYKDGMVEDSPFNIETYDFAKIFLP